MNFMVYILNLGGSNAGNDYVEKQINSKKS